METYLSPLPEGVTLMLCGPEGVLFTSRSKWLIPLFELEDWLEGRPDVERGLLGLHDTIGGLAAAMLITRLGIRKVNIDLISEAALSFYKAQGADVTWKTLVERVQCVTETMVDPFMDLEEAHRVLKRKAKLTRGVSLEVRTLSFAYPGKPLILENVSFTVSPGEAVVLEGDNGSGKSTLLKLILSALKPREGEILYDGKRERCRIGYVTQIPEKADFPFSAEEVVGLTTPSNDPARNETIEQCMRRCGCWHLRKSSYRTLSGGEMARVNLARALAGRAGILLFDEPTANLDSGSKENFAQILDSLSKREMPTMVLVNHDRAFGDLLSWRRLRLEGGRLA